MIHYKNKLSHIRRGGMTKLIFLLAHCGLPLLIINEIR